MPTNKNALLRLYYLDKLLQRYNKNFAIDDLQYELEKALAEESGIGTIGIRQIQKDLKFMQESPFFAEIEHKTFHKNENGKVLRKSAIKYKDRSFSIFTEVLNDDEKNLLKLALDLIGEFEGLPLLDNISKLKAKIEDVDTQKSIISISKNPIDTTQFFGDIYSYIRNKKVIKLDYKKFGNTNNHHHTIYPYLLKEYNRRWYLFAGKEEDPSNIYCYALDRIQSITEAEDKEYIEYDGNINDIFNEIIGVTGSKTPAQTILFWVSDFSKDYVKTKPLHDSQIEFNARKCKKLREKYPMLQGGQFFSIQCKKNYELYRELSLFGENLLVLEPIGIRNKVSELFQNACNAYDKISSDK